MNSAIETPTANKHDSTTACVVSSTVRRCKQCQQILPVGEFRKIWHNRERRHTTCRSCRNALRREQRTLDHEKNALRFSGQVNRLVADNELAAVVTLTSEMLAHCGGIDRFLVTWRSALNRASEAGRHHLYCRGLTAVLNLTTVVATLHELDSQPQQLDDEDVRHQLEVATINVVRCHPEMVLRAARQLGWTLIPPDNNANDGRPAQ